jgi:hypothetical protein
MRSEAERATNSMSAAISYKYAINIQKIWGPLGPSFWVSFGENIRLQRDIFSSKQEL